MNRKSNQLIIIVIGLTVIALALTRGNLGGSLTRPSKVQRDTHILSFGYLSANSLPDSLTLIPAPPANGSDAMRRDEEARNAALASLSSARLTQAATDSVLAFPQAARNFSCALGVEIDKDRTPRLYSLMGKMLIDVRASAYRAKSHYKRPRPFVVHNARSCAPDYAEMVRGDGSYPSGQSATGWAYALVLSELNPARRDAIMQRARDFGQSRLMCDVQWRSDIDAGHVIGEAIVARLRKEGDFQADVAAAREEVSQALRSGSKPTVDCAAETAALRNSRPVAF